MPEIGSSGLMSGDGKRGVGHRPQATAPILDSTRNGHRSFHDRWPLLLLLSASPVDLFAVITSGFPATSGYSVPAWDKLGALSRIRCSPKQWAGSALSC
jgi:hypothetical protein